MTAFKLGDYLNEINLTKKNICRGDPEATKGYPAFVVNRSLSYHQALIPLCDQLNQLRRLDNLQHFEFLLYTVPKGKRFAKWEKPQEIEDIELIARDCECSKERAREYYQLFPASKREELMVGLREKYAEGGAEKKTKVKRES